MLYFALAYIFKGAEWGRRRGEQRAAKVIFSWEITGVPGRGRCDVLRLHGAAAPGTRHPAPAQPGRPDPGSAPVGAAARQSWVQLRPARVRFGAILFFLVSLVQTVSLGSACK